MPNVGKQYPIVTENEAVLALPRVIPRMSPAPIPTPHIYEEPQLTICINVKWFAHLIGLFEVWDQPDAWQGEPEQVEATRNEIRQWLVDILQGNSCMPFDPCCPEEISVLNDIKTALLDLNAIQTTISNNLEISIDNDTTIINQNEQVIVNQYQQSYQNFVTNNTNVINYNQQLYDGEPQSIYPDAGENFNSTGDGKLCAAIDTYINAQIYTHGQEANNLQYAANTLAGAFIALGVLLSVISAGASIAIGVAAGTAIYLAANVWESILNDPEAQRKVKCCMYDALVDQPLTRENFQTSVDSCDFEGGSNEATLAQQISHDNTYYEENWLAFLRAMSQASEGSAEDCSCDCDDDLIIVSHGAFTSTITPMGNCIYRIYQPIPNEGGAWFMGFKDELGRCLHVELSPDPAYPSVGVGVNTTVVDCDDVESNFVGGFAPGDLKSVYYNGGGDLHMDHYKITLAE